MGEMGSGGGRCGCGANGGGKGGGGKGGGGEGHVSMWCAHPTHAARAAIGAQLFLFHPVLPHHCRLSCMYHAGT